MVKAQPSRLMDDMRKQPASKISAGVACTGSIVAPERIWLVKAGKYCSVVEAVHTLFPAQPDFALDHHQSPSRWHRQSPTS